MTSTSRTSRALLDTSVFIARESARRIGRIPDESTVSVVTLAELHLGVLMAETRNIRAVRLRTLTSVQSLFEPLPIDQEVARTFAEIVADSRQKGRKPKIMDTWIAATAVAHGLTLHTQDEGFLSLPRVRVTLV